MIRFTASFAVLALAAAGPSQAQAVDYPDSGLGQPAELLFPFYTLGSGGTIRYQTMCPGSFGGLPTWPMIVRGFGLQIGGQAHYTRFEVRLGATTTPQLTQNWLTNLPDQTVQADLSGTVLQGGGTLANPVNHWVEYGIRKPFLWQPGEGITLDVIGSATTPGLWCFTASGNGARLYDAPYLNGPTGGALLPTSGIKFRILFEPLGVLTYGVGCAGSGGFTPTLTAQGTAAIGATTTVDLGSAVGGSAAALSLGFSRHQAGATPLPLSLGGGCSLLTSSEFSVFTAVLGAGAGNGTASVPLAVPTDPSLRGLTLFAQWLVLDPASPAFVMAVTSNGGVLVLN